MVDDFVYYICAKKKIFIPFRINRSIVRKKKKRGQISRLL